MSANMNLTLCADTFDPFCMRTRSHGLASRSVLLILRPRGHLSTDESLDPDSASRTTSMARSCVPAQLTHEVERTKHVDR
jgi:hypothetical protein